jgi:hypothetical protein
MTLVDVLAAIAILAATVTILAPLTIDARAGVNRSIDALALHATLSRLQPPMTQEGEADNPALPAGCRLRWRSRSLSIAADSGSARLLSMQVVRGLGADELILAERFVPLPSGP